MWCSHCPVIDIDRAYRKDAGKREKMLNGAACGVHIAPLLILTMHMEKMLEGEKRCLAGRRVVFMSPHY